MKYLRGFIIKALKGTDFSVTKYTNYNRVINQYCTVYYCKYQKDRNEKLCNEEIQEIRVIDWYNHERNKAIEG